MGYGHDIEAVGKVAQDGFLGGGIHERLEVT
jgi:hypothetical protein